MPLPDYLTDLTYDTIMQRMMAALPADLDKSEGGFIWDALSPLAIELALAVEWAKEVLRLGFASTAASSVAGEVTDWLDKRAEEHGLTRRAAVKATGTVTFSGTPGTVIPAGTRVSTGSTVTVPAVVFETTVIATVGAGGTVSTTIQAVEAGANGNVGAGTITFMVAALAGISGVTNASSMTGGLDTEDDASLLTRYYAKVRTPGTSGNKADYINWAGEVSGVGGVSVVPVKYGNGTVSVAILDTNKQPASQSLLDTVLDYIAAPWSHDVEAETMTVGGSGTSVDDTQLDDSGTSVKMVYDVAGVGTITHANIHTLLDRPGIWRAKPKVKASDITGANDLLQVGIWNTTTGVWAKVSTDPAAADAVTIYQGNDLSLVFGYLAQQFYWNGTDGLELRITRLQTDNSTTVWADQVKYISTFSKDTGGGKAPVGAAVFVEPAAAVSINVSATLTVLSGYDPATVKAAAETAINDYLKSIAFQGVNDDLKQTENDVKYARIANAILDTEGVEDYTNLLVNGGMANIAIGAQEVAVKGTVMFS